MTIEEELHELLEEFKVQRTFIINQLATTFEEDELHKFTGRIFQIQHVIERLNSILEKDD